MATVRKRGDLQWQAIVKRRGHALSSKTFETRKDAEGWARSVERAMDLRQYVPNREAERTLLHELIERYRRDVLPTKQGKHFGPALRLLDERLGHYALAAITPKVVADLRDSRLLEGRSGSTVRKEVNLLSRMIDLASKEWGIHLPSNPCTMVSRPRESNARERRLEGNEASYLIAACSPELRSLVLLALETAARAGELLSLRWVDVDFEKRVAIVRGKAQRGTKNGEPLRALPLSSAAVVVLEGLPRTGDRVFHWKGADSLNHTWTRALKRAKSAYESECRLAGTQPSAGFLDDLRFHDLRHEATSRLFERGVFDSMEVASITGHKTLTMLKRYTHLRAESLARKLG